MINIVAGMLAPDAGEILLGGAPVEIGSTRRAIELGIATVYQELSLLPNLSVAQNIALGREPRRHGFLDVARDARDERRGARADRPRHSRRNARSDRCRSPSGSWSRSPRRWPTHRRC